MIVARTCRLLRAVSARALRRRRCAWLAAGPLRPALRAWRRALDGVRLAARSGPIGASAVVADAEVACMLMACSVSAGRPGGALDGTFGTSRARWRHGVASRGARRREAIRARGERRPESAGRTWSAHRRARRPRRRRVGDLPAARVDVRGRRGLRTEGSVVAACGSGRAPTALRTAGHVARSRA